jgi:alpha-glucosidase
VTEVQQVPGGVFLRCAGALARVTFVTPDIVRVRVGRHAELGPERSFAVTYAGEPPAVEVDDSARRLVIECSGRTVEIDRNALAVRIVDTVGRPVSEDDAERGVTLVPGGGLRVHRHLPPGERYLGFGERAGFLHKRGERLDNWNTDAAYYHTPDRRHLYASIPFFLALSPSRAGQGQPVDPRATVIHGQPPAGQTVWGFFLDNAGYSAFDMGTGADPAQGWIEVTHGDYDAYTILGPGAADVLSRYALLTGRSALPPLWALGYHQCRYSYVSAHRVREVAAELRRRKIPAEAVWLDIHYLDGFRVFTFDRDGFPDPRRLAADLHAQGFKLVTILDPGVKLDPGYRVYDEGLAGGHFLKRANGAVFAGQVWPGEAVFTDFTRPESREWWREQLAVHLGMGVDGIWNDMNEPANFEAPDDGRDEIRPLQWSGRADPVSPDRPWGRRTLSADVLFEDGGRWTAHPFVHNAYGQLMCETTYEAMARVRPGRRPFILSRSGYAGIQRSAAMWMGDNYSTWDHLAMSVPQLLNMGLSGVPLVGADIGGFAADCSPELLVRWSQLGAFYPFCRNHSGLGTADQEPWAFGPEVERLVRDALRLRYRYLPYLYSLLEEAHRTGLPPMRAMLLEYPDDQIAVALDDQFLLGSELLVAPILRPGKPFRSVYLPQGRWIDYWTGDDLRGPRALTVSAPLERIPFFVRAGAALPVWTNDPQHTGAAPPDRLDLEVWSGGDSEGELYSDSGDGEWRGEAGRTRVVVKLAAGSGQVVVTPGAGVEATTLRLEVVGARTGAVLTHRERAVPASSSGRLVIEAPMDPLGGLPVVFEVR